MGQKTGLNPAAYGTHTLSRTKAALIYIEGRRISRLRSLLGHSTVESTVQYLGIEVDDGPLAPAPTTTISRRSNNEPERCSRRPGWRSRGRPPSTCKRP